MFTKPLTVVLPLPCTWYGQPSVSWSVWVSLVGKSVAAVAMAGVGCGEPGHAGRVAGCHTAPFALRPRRRLGLPAGVGRTLLSRGEDAIHAGEPHC